MDTDQVADAYRDSHGAVYSFLLRRLGHHETAEDLTAETFARAVARWDSYTEQGSCRQAWLMTIARNILLDHFKSSRVKREVHVAEMDTFGPQTPDCWEQVEHALRCETVSRALAPLQPNHRRCLQLRYFAGMTGPQTARHLGISDGAVKQLQVRALESARRHLTTGVFR